MTAMVEVAAVDTARLGARTSIVRLHDRSGRIGCGEASPLPGRSPESPDDCHHVLARLSPAALGRLPPTADAIAAAVAVLEARFPAARLALETALLDLAAQATGASIAELLAPRPAARVACSAIVAPDGRGAPPGITTWKVKLGEPDRLDRDLADLRAALQGRSIELRLDINRRWSGVEAARYLPQLFDLTPQWVEEPTSAAELLGLAPVPVALALDESLLDAEGDAVRALERGLVRALVLKPAVLGGLAAAAAWAGRARRAGALPIVSHLLDGPIALAAYAELALALARPGDPAAGLGRHAGLDALPAAAVPQLSADGLHLASHRGGLGVAL